MIKYNFIIFNICSVRFTSHIFAYQDLVLSVVLRFPILKEEFQIMNYYLEQRENETFQMLVKFCMLSTSSNIDYKVKDTLTQS